MRGGRSGATGRWGGGAAAEELAGINDDDVADVEGLEFPAEGVATRDLKFEIPDLRDGGTWGAALL